MNQTVKIIVTRNGKKTVHDVTIEINGSYKYVNAQIDSFVRTVWGGDFEIKNVVWQYA